MNFIRKSFLGIATLAFLFALNGNLAMAAGNIPWSDPTNPVTNASVLMGSTNTVFTWSGLNNTTGLSLIGNTTNNTQTVLNVSANGAVNNYAAIFNGGNVGIGTTTPGTALTVNGIITTGSGSSTTPSIASIADPNTGIFFLGNSHSVRFAVNGAERMRLTGNGSLGIGSSLDQTFFPLDIRKSQNSPLSLHITNQNSGSLAETTLGLMNDSSSGDTVSELFLNSTTNPGYGGVNSLNLYNYTPNGSLTFGTNFLERIRITSTGNVGIGTTTPKAVLDVSSTTSGFLPPRMTKEDVYAIVHPVEGMIVYNTDSRKLQVFNGKDWETIQSE